MTVSDLGVWRLKSGTSARFKERGFQTPAVTCANRPLAYAFAWRGDGFEASANASYLDRFDSQNTPTSPVASILDRPNDPLSLRGRAGLGWSRGAWNASTHVNYVTDYRGFDGERVGSWSTADLQIRYAPDQSMLAGTSIALTVRNLFDRDPPF